jgi:DNA adenine methylase
MNSFINSIGGKKLLRKQILEQFPDQASDGRYIEVFGGAGWVLFSRDKHAPLEIFNLINLYRVVKYHPEPLQKEMEWLLMSRENSLMN